VEQIGIADNFFDLGGHSLNATQLVSRLRMKFGVDLTLAEFFVSPTIKDVSRQIEMALIQQTSAEDLDTLIATLGS
jgi:acyl carrier protein